MKKQKFVLFSFASVVLLLQYYYCSIGDPAGTDYCTQKNPSLSNTTIKISTNLDRGEATFLDRNKGELPAQWSAPVAKGISSLALLLLQPGNIVQIHHKKGGYAVSRRRPACLQTGETDVAPTCANTPKTVSKHRSQCCKFWTELHI